MAKENIYPLLFQSIKDYSILMLDTDGIVRYSNDATATVKGYSPEEIIGKSFEVCYPESEIEIGKPRQDLASAIKNKRFEEEAWRIRKDGSKFWSSTVITPVYNDKGEHIGFSDVTRDLTERRKAEENLRESEERSRLLIEAVKDYAIFRLDPDGFIASWNEGARRINGYAAHEIIGKHFSVFYTRDDLDDHKPERELEIATKTGRYEEEGWRVRKNGTLFWSSVVITALFNDRNELVGFGKVTRDLTERKEAEEALRASEEQYRLLVNSVRDYGIFMLDEKGKIISWNEGAKRINGYTKEEIIGKHFSIFYPKEDIENDKPARELKIAKAEGKYEEEGWRIRKDGTKYWAGVIITAVRNEKGTLLGYSKVTRDLTERRLAERALRDSEERFRLLAGELEITNKELEQFTSIVSHDLQEPLRTVNSYLQLIERHLKDKLDDETREFISLATNAGKRMRELIISLLEYAQLNKGEISFEEIDVPELLKMVLQNLQESMRASGATVNIQNNVETIKGSRIQLSQLLQNLVSNALKFRDEDAPVVTIGVEDKTEEILFFVKDNGIGIDKEYQEKIFKIFSRIHSKEEYPGTGIGLAVAKKIVQRHGGKIWVESEQGKGTTFYFTIRKNPSA